MTNPQVESREKAPAAVGKTRNGFTRATAKKRKPVYQPIQTPPIPNIYAVHPHRKLFELWVYDCMRGRSLGGSTSRRAKPVRIPARELKQVIRTKKDELQVKRAISGHIRWHFHPDLKVLFWDYLDHLEFPRTIDLSYDQLDPKVWRIANTPEQRKTIEIYARLVCPIKTILYTVNSRELGERLSRAQLQQYLYFFFNLDAEPGAHPYPPQLLSQMVLKIRENIDSQNYYRRECHRKKIDPRLTFAAEQQKLLATIRQVPDQSRCLVKTPYLDRDHDEEAYRPWARIAPRSPCRDDTVLPIMGSYGLVCKICTGTVTLEELALEIDFKRQNNSTSKILNRMLDKLLCKAEILVNQEDCEGFSRVMKTMLIPLAKLMRTLGVTPDISPDRMPGIDRVREEDAAQYENCDEIQVLPIEEHMHTYGVI
ncbi:MAG: hypothetical protein GXO90_00935 [FCB group bacterium]|nr:hypothetical protein [FCB group bacterium]